MTTTAGGRDEVQADRQQAARSTLSAVPTDRDTAGLELIAKVDAVMRVLESRGEASAAEIAKRTGEPLSSVYRLLQSLTGVGWVDRGWRRGTYRLGLLLLTIGGLLEDKLDVRECALPSLRRLVETTGTTSFLCVRRDTRAVCVERLEGQAVRSLAMQLGSSLPLFAGAAPRAILAFLPPAEQRSSLRASRLPGRSGPSGGDGYPGRHRTCPTGRLCRLRRRCHSWDRRVGRAGVQPSGRAGCRHLDQRAQVPDPGLLSGRQYRVDHLVCA